MDSMCPRLHSDYFERPEEKNPLIPKRVVYLSVEGTQTEVTNPCFEFWLLLHLCDVKNEYAGHEDELLKNERESNRHTYVSGEVSRLAQHGKRIPVNKFDDYYLPNIPLAIERAVKDFATEFPDILDYLGTNLSELLHELGFSENYFETL